MDVPDFLQTKQEASFSKFRNIFSDKKRFRLIVLVLLLFAIPLTVWLAQKTQIFRPRAASGPIELVVGQNSCVVSATDNTVSCASFPIKLTSPLEGEFTSSLVPSFSPQPSVSPSPSLSPSASPNSCENDSQCPAGQSCQVVAGACTNSIPPNCTEFRECRPNGFKSPLPSSSPSDSVPPSSNPSPVACTNLVKNGSFENPAITNSLGWTTYGATADLAAQDSRATIQNIADWNGRTGSSKYQVELQKSLFGAASNGVQYAEIDQPGVVSLTQDVSTEASKQYQIKFDYSPRTDRNTPQKMGVYWNDQQVGVIDGTSHGSSLNWQTKTFTVTANGATSKLGFGALSDSTLEAGNFIDNVSVTIVAASCANVSAASGSSNIASAFTEKLYSSVVNEFNAFKFVPKAQAQSNVVCPNIAKNGGFENPGIISPLNWSTYGAAPDLVAANPQQATATVVPDWLPRTDARYQVELQKSLFGPAFEGSQYAEIDQPGVVSLNQNLTTEANKQYLIEFAYSPRNDRNTPQKMGVYWNNQQIGVIDGTSHGTTLNWQTKTFAVTATSTSSKLSFGALSESFEGAGNFIDDVSVSLADCNGSSPSPSGQSSSSPSTQIRTISYKLAESEAGLASATSVPYSSHPTLTNFTFSNSTPGVKQIWAEFIGVNGETRKEHISVELLEPEARLTSVDCSMDISKQNLKLTLKGSRLGGPNGKITVNSKETQVTSWEESLVNATFKPEGDLQTGAPFKVALTTKDGKTLPEVTCLVDTSLISLGARLFCRAPGQFDVNGVKAIIIDENGNQVGEDVTITADGLIKDLNTKLQVDRPYSLAIKAPSSLRKTADFIAAYGTTVVKPRDDEDFILPVGDIAPVILPDGKINTPDRSEIVRQWSLLGAGDTRSADFNRDSKVNSIDWACMRFDFNKEDETIPVRAGQGGSCQPACASGGVCVNGSCFYNGSSSPSPVLTASPSSVASSSATPSGQRSAFLLLTPLEGGTYKNGDEFIVDVNIVSRKESANLFAAKIAFDAQAMEVVGIERGPALTTWAEEYFDNDQGQISLVAGRPTPGLQTEEGNDPRMARIIFRAKNVGVTEIRLTSESKIYSNSDNINILNSLLSTQIVITN